LLFHDFRIRVARETLRRGLCTGSFSVRTFKTLGHKSFCGRGFRF
jgi:hypothetical protein